MKRKPQPPCRASEASASLLPGPWLCCPQRQPSSLPLLLSSAGTAFLRKMGRREARQCHCQWGNRWESRQVDRGRRRGSGLPRLRARPHGAHTCIHIVGPPAGLAAASRWGAACPGIEDIVDRALHLAVINGLGALGGAGEGGAGSGGPRVAQVLVLRLRKPALTPLCAGSRCPPDNSTAGHSFVSTPEHEHSPRAPWPSLPAPPPRSPSRFIPDTIIHRVA